jgi:hypothetical protein
MKLNILPIACPYILSLILFIVDNQKDFLTNACAHSLDTRIKHHLYLPIVSLSCVQKGVSYSAGKALIALQAMRRVIEMTGKDSKTGYTDTIFIHSFYSVTEFLECKLDKDNK